MTREKLTESTLGILDLDIRKQVTLLDKLENDEVNDVFLTVWFHEDLTVAVVLDQLNDVWVTHLLQERNFV